MDKEIIFYTFDKKPVSIGDKFWFIDDNMKVAYRICEEEDGVYAPGRFLKKKQAIEFYNKYYLPNRFAVSEEGNDIIYQLCYMININGQVFPISADKVPIKISQDEKMLGLMTKVFSIKENADKAALDECFSKGLYDPTISLGMLIDIIENNKLDVGNLLELIKEHVGYGDK